MKLNIPVTTVVEVDISVVKIGRYLDRTGWELLYIRDDGASRLARWHHRPSATPLFLRSDDFDPRFLDDAKSNAESHLGRIAMVEGREPHEVALDASREQE